MEFEKLNLSLKRSGIKKLNEKQKEIYKDILRVGRSIVHYREVFNIVSSFPNTAEILPDIRPELMKENEMLNWRTCYLCEKYFELGCFGCPLTKTTPDFKCFKKESPFGKLTHAFVLNKVKGFLYTELNFTLPALYYTLKNYKGLLDDTKKYNLQSIMWNAWQNFKSGKFSSFSLSLTNAWRIEKEKTITVSPNDYINSPEFIQTLNKYAVYAKHKFFSGEGKEVNEIVNDLFIVSHNALNRYNPDKGLLKTYLYTRIRGYLLDCLRNKKRTQLPVFNVDEVQEMSEPYDFISFYSVNKIDNSAKETLDTLGEYVKQIPGKAVDVYNLIRQGYNLKETGKKLELSESRVCQIVQTIKYVANKNRTKILY